MHSVLHKECVWVVHAGDEIVKGELLNVDVQHEWLVKQALVHLGGRGGVRGRHLERR